MRVAMCDCDSAPVFVSGWVLGCSLSWISVGPPSNMRPVSSLPHSLPVAGILLVCWWFFVSRAGCFGVCQLTFGRCLAGPGPPGSVWSLLGGGVPRGIGSLGPWLDLLRRRWLLARPVGLLWQPPGASALPGSFRRLLLGFPCSGGPLDVCLGS
ncbi:hypothetical protein ATANTOWER_029970 [Ataeniobius toweri]|uniref:Uncharacterized protein n=1 Tax=Ataeniobius toweri TaxID=208326 RepID=A0ABU7C694_9TELE|nr:hypothetical protein [Ataeniobius toweri]